MDILMEELLKERQSLSEETGRRNFFKRSEIEHKRIQKRRAEVKRDAEAKRHCENQNQANSSDPESSLNPYFKLDSTKSKPESGADSSSKVPITDDSLNLPKQEVIRHLWLLRQPVTLFGESDDDRLDRLKYVLQAGLFELDDRDMRTGQMNDIVELKRRIRNGAGDEDGDDPMNTKKNFFELCDEDKILSFFMLLLIEWNQELDKMTEMEKMTAKGKSTLAAFEQCARYLNPLFNLCRKKILHHDIRQALMLLVNCCMKRDYPAALDHYCQIAMGKSPKFNTNRVAHVMNDETTRKYLTSVKRLMVFCQSRRPKV